MATALQQQLAAISVKSTHQLDLKAQKAQHAESLLLEPADAARQSFDDIYQVCIEGFEELCQLDTRFLSFSNNLFSEDSKAVDRGQLTQTENEELDGVVQRFLGLIQGRLLLKPAQKSVEWLVRRWKVHECNTQALLLTFLPYHTDERITPALLSILPTDKELPETFKWLHPYIATRSCPPRHAILAAAVSNRGLFSALSSYVLSVAKVGHASSVVLGFWAGLTAQAVNSMLESSRTGRENVRMQREEEILLKVLPVLQEALLVSRKNALDELFVGSCMIITVLATKASLSHTVLDAMMEAVAGAWSETTLEEGLSCLAVLAEEKDELLIPATVTKAMLKRDVLPILSRQAKSQRVSSLTGRFAIGVLRFACKKDDSVDLHLVRDILFAEILLEKDAVAVYEAVMSGLNDQPDGDVHSACVEILSNQIEMERDLKMIEQAARSAKVDLGRLGMGGPLMLDVDPEPVPTEAMILDHHSETEPTAISNFDKILQNLPELPVELYSFLEPTRSATDYFLTYSRAFHAALASQTLIESFWKRLSPSHSASMSSPTLLSFAARIWSSGNPSITIAAKVAALEIARRELENAHASDRTTKNIGVDVQHLFPYLLTALADERQKVRSAAVSFCRSMEKLSRRLETKSGTEDAIIWAETSIYDNDIPTSNVDNTRLSSANARRFLTVALLPVMEDCILDPKYIVRHLVAVLNNTSSAESGATEKSTKLHKDFRISINNFLAFHASKTPVLRSKVCLLEVIRMLGKEMRSAREQILLPFTKEWFSLSKQAAETWGEIEGVTTQQVDSAVLGILWHRSDEHAQLLRDICCTAERHDLLDAAFKRQRQIWKDMKSEDAKVNLIHWFLELALERNGDSSKVHDLALETLRSLELSPSVIAHMLTSLPAVSDLETQPPAAKRQRRTSESNDTRTVDRERLQPAVRKITLVLELLEAFKQHTSELLKPLFNLLAELRQFKNLMGSELVYLHVMLLESLLSTVSSLTSASAVDESIKRDVVRTDLLIECVRSSTSPQIHNAALLLMSALASWTPENVLHSVMPMFTFMSSTVLRRSDEYSAHVTDQAVSKIVPALADSLRRSGKDLTGGISELLLSFVAAWEHVPLHRRLGLFEMVVNAVGPSDCLGVVTAMLAERYSEGNSSAGDFVVELVNRFDPVITLIGAAQWLKLIDEVSRSGAKKKRDGTSLSDTLFGIPEKTEVERLEVTVTLLDGLAALLRDKSLSRRFQMLLSGDGQDGAKTIRSTYASLLEQTIDLSQRVTSSDVHLKAAGDGALSAALGLLPTKDFILSSAQLMQSGSDSTRQQVFHSLEARVQSSRANNSTDRQTFIDVLPSCAVFIKDDQSVEVRMAAIGCIDIICEKFGRKDPLIVRDVAETIAGKAALISGDNRLRNLSLLCLASILGVLGDRDESISTFPTVLSTGLDYLATSTDVRANDIDKKLSDAAFRFLIAVLDNVPWILTSAPAELDRAIMFAAQADGDSESANEFRHLAATKVPASELLQSIERVWATCIVSSSEKEADSIHRFLPTVRNLIAILQGAVRSYSKGTVTMNASSVFNLLLHCFDLRRLVLDTAIDFEIQEYDNVFLSVEQLAMDVTVKMNDATFRPLFSQLVQWATSSLPQRDLSGRTQRMTSLYGFAFHFFEKLKSLVTTHTSFLLESAGEVLSISSIDLGHDALLPLVMKTLGSSFRHDEDDFWTAPAHFDIVATSLINRLKTDDTKQSETSDLTIRTITDFAAAVSGSPEQLKAINSYLLSLLKHNSPNVRFASLQCQRMITKRVTFDWLALLPEILPVISELQEDDDEGVEYQTLLWVKEIEEISGESLEGMLA